MLELFPDRRPIVVTRAAIPGMQAFAHGASPCFQQVVLVFTALNT